MELEAPRTFQEALEFAQREHKDETMDWTGYCQMFCRTAYGVPALYGSAWAQWLGADDEDKHVANDPDKAPVGSLLCFKGSGPYGHIMLAARNEGAWSNDLVRTGDIDYVEREAPVFKWGQNYLGWLGSINEYDIDPKSVKPPKPKQDKHYKLVQSAINKIERAIENAVRRGDKPDAKVLRRELHDLKELYGLLRHA